METKKLQGSSFVRQASILAAAALLSRFIGFIYRPLLTNIIGDHGNSIYADGYYIYTFFLILSSAGLPVAISKMVSGRIASKKYRSAHKVFLVSLQVGGVISLLACTIMIFGAKQLANLIGSPESYKTLITLAPTVVIVTILSSFRGYFQGMGTSVPTAISQLIEQIVNAFFTVFLAYMFISKSVENAAAGGTAATGIGAIAGLIVMLFIYIIAKPNIKKNFSRSVDKSTAEKKFDVAKELLFITIPIIIGAAVFSISNLVDTFMVKNLIISMGKSPEYAKSAYGILSGKYFTLITLPVSISAAFATASMPSISASHQINDNKGVENKINMAMRITMMITIPSAAGLCVLADQILLLLFPAYPAGGELIRIGSAGVLFLALSQITTGMLQGIGKVNLPAVGALVGTLIKIPVNYIFIKTLGFEAVGAVIGTLACYIFSSMFNLYILLKHTNIKLRFNDILFKPLYSALIMGMSCFCVYNLVYLLVPNNTLCTLASIVASVFVYFFILFLLGGLKRSDIIRFPMTKKLVSFLDSRNLFD